MKQAMFMRLCFHISRVKHVGIEIKSVSNNIIMEMSNVRRVKIGFSKYKIDRHIVHCPYPNMLG